MSGRAERLKLPTPAERRVLRSLPDAVLERELERRHRARMKKNPKRWRCNTCSQIYTAGGPVTVFADHGVLWCRPCNNDGNRTVRPSQSEGRMEEVSS